MSLLPTALVLLVVSLLPSTAAQDGTPHIDGAQNSKVAITGAIIGAVLVVISLIAVAVYSIERCLHRRKSTSFTPLPTQSEAEPYQYLSLPRPPKSDPYGHGPYYPGNVASPPASPNPRASRSTYAGSPLRSPGGRSVHFDPYEHGPYYPGSPPASPHAPASSPRASPMAQSFRQDSQRLSSSPASNTKSTTPASSLRDARQPPSRTLSRATSATLVS
ncbi:hypothetical protein B0H17DRAFT_1202240 [Mycena rosella]|uniref:Uncharacterized protein n=1 Tax=Mycena rosella TaxID=1033263 RepID=A0AAD7DF09_MYCRO|nr:hypothetical protein B0H17DRAFT_1202240 [Mycena rosella]